MSKQCERSYTRIDYAIIIITRCDIFAVRLGFARGVRQLNLSAPIVRGRVYNKRRKKKRKKNGRAHGCFSRAIVRFASRRDRRRLGRIEQHVRVYGLSPRYVQARDRRVGIVYNIILCVCLVDDSRATAIMALMARH